MSKLFAIGLEVEEVAVGKILRVLDAMPGVARINLNLSGQKANQIEEGAEAVEEPSETPTASPTTAVALGPRKPVRPYKPRVGKDSRGRCDEALASALKGGELPLKELTTFVVRRGFSPISASSVLNDMQRRGYVKRIGAGIWGLTPFGHKHFDQVKTTASSTSFRKGQPSVRLGIIDNSRGIRRTVLDLLRTGPKSHREVVQALIDHGLSPKNMSGTVYKMRIDPPGLIALNRGIYSLTSQGSATIEKIIEAEQAPKPSQPQPQPQEAAE